MSDGVAEFRSRAECLERAKATIEADVARQYFELAEWWLKLAVQAEQQTRFDEREK
jgi:outer membrane protein TolC